MVESAHGPAVLKVGNGRAGEDILDESKRLVWLNTRLGAPEIISHESWRGHQYLMLSYRPGFSAHERADLGAERVTALFASQLRSIHALPITQCPFVDVTNLELSNAVRALDEKRIDLGAFRLDVGMEAPAVLELLLGGRSGIVEDIFTHGDLCLPNLIIDDDRVSGVIDWGLAGVANRNRDFMSAELTIRRNFGEALIPVFYRAYGSSGGDASLVRYYWLLDRFSTHLLG